MADALISSLVNLILGNLNSTLLQELGIASGLNSELTNLESTLSTIKAVLQDAEAKQSKSEAINNWLRKLKDAAYDADNVLDEFTVEGLRRKIDSQRGLMKTRVSTFLSLRNPFIFRFKMGHKLKNIRERLDLIAEERIKFHLIEGINDLDQVGEFERRQTSSIVIESEIVGRDNEKEKIIESLINNLGDDNHDDVSVYAILGMGGLGKTTLAQLVYNDGRVQTHFELRVWVCVSNDFDTLRLTKAIIESIEGAPCDIVNLDPLQRCLQEKLSGKRFLLVLDDVWNEDCEKWDALKGALRCGAKGSTILVTTRVQNAAFLMDALPAYHIGFLSEDHSWSLFKKRAFGVGMIEENLVEYETIGKAIVKKCGGVPLAVKALGSLMRFKKSTTEWLSVKESELWDLSDRESTILPALRLSYDNLPLYLRQCFAYCSIFPKDYVMYKDTLIQLWMAHEFIPSRGHMELHETGNEIFNNLVWGSFLQDVKEDFEGYTTCKMHDLMHDLAQSIIRHECFIVERSKALKVSEAVRHLSFFAMSSSQKVPWNDDLHKVQHLRSLVLLPGFYDLGDAFSTYISKLKHLRVLDLKGSYFGRSPISISNLKHLRYLNFSFTSIKTLPESTTSLQNLQTLNLQCCSQLHKLPKGMKYMRNLRYLDIRGCPLSHTPSGLGQLAGLQTLGLFIVGKESGHRICELENLNLRGELIIKELDNIRNSVEAKSSNLKGKQNLVSLHLYWRYSKKDNSIPDNVEEVLDGLDPHPNLKKLGIRSYQGSKFPNWFMDSILQNLVEVSLQQCEGCEHLPPLGKLPLLKVLYLGQMNSVKYFNNELYADGWNSFPMLERLTLNAMPNLEEWTRARGGQSFSRLLDVKITECPKLMELPLLPSVKELEILKGTVTLLGSVMNLTSLSSLRISGFFELELLPGGLLQNLKDLERLKIETLPNLKTLSNELDNLSSLKDLTLQCCTSLESLPNGLENLNSLQSLEIHTCDSLISLPEDVWHGLSSLRKLRIQSCQKLKSISEGVRYLTALQDLVISCCPEIKFLPDGMQQLTALRRLEILNWDDLASFANELQGTNVLKNLKIEGYPLLASRIEKESGEDWPKIAHIPEIYFNNRQIQSLDCQ